jgi:hypothetical protein
VGVHSRKHGRYRCQASRKTFTESHGTPLYASKTDLNAVTLILTLLIFGCPLPAIVMAFKISERTLADWLDKSGEHAQRVQDHLVCQGDLELGQVQADELWGRSSAVCCGWPQRLLISAQVGDTRVTNDENADVDCSKEICLCVKRAICKKRRQPWPRSISS